MRPGVGPALRQPLAEITHGRSYGAAAIRLSISVVSKRSRFPSLSDDLVHDITDVDGDFGQPA